jgi:hypothetical protein
VWICCCWFFRDGRIEDVGDEGSEREVEGMAWLMAVVR